MCGNPLGVIALIGKNDQGPSADVPSEAEPAEPLPESPSEPEAERPSAENVQGQSPAGESARPSSEAVPPEVLRTSPSIDEETTPAETTHADAAAAPTSAHDPVESSDDPPLAAPPQEITQPAPETEPRIAFSATEHPATTSPKASISRTRSRGSSPSAQKTPRGTQEIEVEKQTASVETEHVEILADMPRSRPYQSLSFKAKLNRVFKGQFRSGSHKSTPASEASTGKAEDGSKSRVRRAFKQGYEVVTQRQPKLLRRSMFNIRHFVRHSAKMR